MATKANQRKILAILAGGLVLGVGAAVTLAAWNDSEFATGTFTAGAFDLEGSTTSAASGYASHNTEATPPDAAATLVFQLPAVASNMAPGDTVYAPFWVRLAADTTTDATLDAAGVTASADASSNAENLSYTVYSIDAAATCDAAGIAGADVVASGATLSAFTAGVTENLANGAPVTDAGAPVQLCFEVTAGAGLTQGEAATATWQFTATSTS